MSGISLPFSFDAKILSEAFVSQFQVVSFKLAQVQVTGRRCWCPFDAISRNFLQLRSFSHDAILTALPFTEMTMKSSFSHGGKPEVVAVYRGTKVGSLTHYFSGFFLTDCVHKKEGGGVKGSKLSNFQHNQEYFQQTHNQGLRQLFLAVSWDLRAQYVTPEGVLICLVPIGT